MDWETPQIADGKIFRTMILSPRCREVLGKTSWVGHVVPSRKIKDGNKVQKNITTCFSPLKRGGVHSGTGVTFAPTPGVTFAPIPKGVKFAPTPLSFPLTVSFNLLV